MVPGIYPEDPGIGSAVVSCRQKNPKTTTPFNAGCAAIPCEISQDTRTTLVYEQILNLDVKKGLRKGTSQKQKSKGPLGESNPRPPPPKGGITEDSKEGKTE